MQSKDRIRLFYQFKNCRKFLRPENTSGQYFFGAVHQALYKIFEIDLDGNPDDFCIERFEMFVDKIAEFFIIRRSKPE